MSLLGIVSYYFCSFFALASSYPLDMFEIFNHGHSFTKFTSGWRDKVVFFNYLNKSEIGTFFVCLFQSMASSLLHKSNTMYLSKETTNKDKSLKTQLSLSTGTGDEKSADTEKVWDKPGFFGDQVTDFTINKVNFPKNTLKYANQY